MGINFRKCKKTNNFDVIGFAILGEFSARKAVVSENVVKADNDLCIVERNVTLV